MMNLIWLVRNKKHSNLQLKYDDKVSMTLATLALALYTLHTFTFSPADGGETRVCLSNTLLWRPVYLRSGDPFGF